MQGQKLTYSPRTKVPNTNKVFVVGIMIQSMSRTASKPMSYNLLEDNKWDAPSNKMYKALRSMHCNNTKKRCGQVADAL